MMVAQSIVKWFLIWGIITASYFMSKYLTYIQLTELVRKDKAVTFWYQLYVYLVFVATVVGISYYIYYFFSVDRIESDDDGIEEQIVGMHFHFLQIFIPIVLPTLMGIYTSIKRHNKSINE